MKCKNKRSMKGWNIGSRIISVILMVSMALTLAPVPARAGVFDDIVDWVEDKVESISQSTVGPLIKEGLNIIGMDKVYRKAQDAFNYASSTAQGKLPMVETVMNNLFEDAKRVADDSLKEMSKVTEALTALQDVGQDIYRLISSIPINFDTEFNLPMPDGGTARVRARRQDMLVDISFWLIGPVGSGMQAVFGISNASPLGDGIAEHFANEGNTLTVFMDITRNGRSYAHARLPVTTGTFPYIAVQDYISLSNGQLIEVKIGSLDETTCTVEFGVSVEATFDYAVTISGGIGASLSLEVNVIHLKAVLEKGMYVLGNKIFEIIDRGDSLTLDTVAEALEEVLEAMDDYGRDHEDAMGEGTVGVSLEGGMGVGVWDCTWNVLNVETGLELAIPASKLGSVTKETLSTLLQAGKTLAELTNSYSAFYLDYHIPNYFPQSLRNEMKADLEAGLPAIENSLKAAGQALLESSIDTELCMYLSVDALGGKDQGVNIMGAEAKIPIGSIVEATTNYLGPTIEGMSKLLGELMSQSMTSYDYNPEEWENLDEVALEIADDTRFKLSVNTPLNVQLVLEASARPLLIIAGGAAGNLLRSAILCMVNSVKSGSLAEFRTNNVLENLVEAEDGLRDLTLGLQFTIGAYAEGGVEVYGGVGLGGSISLNSNVEMLLLFVNGSWDSNDYTGKASLSINGNLSAEVGLSLGEGVEFKAGGGAELSTNFITVTATEYDDSIPPLLYSVEGSASANLQSLKLTAMGYDGQEHTYNANYVKDSRHVLGGYYEIWAPVLHIGDNHVKLEAIAFSSFAKVSLVTYGSGGRVVTGTGKVSDSYTVLDGGQVDCNVEIKSYDGKTTKYYPVAIKAAPNLQIKKLTLDKGKVYPEFYPSVNQYHLSLDCDTDELEITPELVKETGTIMEVNGIGINGVKYNSGSTIKLKNIPYGESTLQITVRFTNSAADPRHRENTYLIRINRAKSANADLRSLQLNRRELAQAVYVPLDFSPGKTYYTLSVDPEVAGVNVIAAVADERSVLRLGVGSQPAVGEPGALSIDRLVPLQYGENRVYLEVTAQNGSKKTYTLNITRRKYQIRNLKVWVNNQEVTLTQGQTSNTGFDPDVYHYVLRIPQGNYGFNFRAEFYSDFSNSLGYYHNGNTEREIGFSLMGVDGGYKHIGNSSFVIENGKDASIAVYTADSKGNGAAYTISILRESEPMTAEAELLTLSYKPGINAQAVSLNVSQKDFEIEVDEGVPGIYLIAGKKDPGDLVLINGVLNNRMDHKVLIEPGWNLVKITVVSKHADVEEYTLRVFRKRDPKENSLASEIKVEGFDISPAFDQERRFYSVEVPYENNSVKIMVKPESSLAQAGAWKKSGGSNIWTPYSKEGAYYVFQASGLKVGSNSATVQVKAENGNISTYELTIHRHPSTDASLKSLGDGGLVLKKVVKNPDTGEDVQIEDIVIDGFHPALTDYTVTVANEFNTARFKAAAAKEDEGAKVVFEADEFRSLLNGWYEMPLFEEKNIYEGGELPIMARENPLKITVVAPDGVTTRTYTIRIIRDIPPDTEKPALIQPLDMVVEGNTPGGANVEFSVRATDIRDGFLQPISENPKPIRVTLPPEASGFFEWDGYILKCNAYFPLRKEPYTIVCEARDRAGNTVSGSFKITVVDTTPPEISGIAEFIEMEATGYYSAATIPEGFTAVDIVDGKCEVFLWPTHAPLGVSGITLVAWDKSGNKGEKNIVVKVTDTTAPDIYMDDYYEVEIENGSEGTYIDWYRFIKDNIDVRDNTGIKHHGIQRVTESQPVFDRAVYLEAGIVERFKYVCTDYGDNTSVREFSLGVKMTTPSKPIAKEKKDIKIIIYPEEAGESRVIEVAASDIAIDKNLDELFCVAVLGNSDDSVADTEITTDGKLKITIKTPGRTDITVQVRAGQDIIPATIPVKVYDTSEELLPPRAKGYTPDKIPLRGSLELEAEDIATDDNGEYLYFDGNVRSVNPYAVGAAIRDGKLVIEGLSSSSVMVYATVTDGHESTEVAVPITVNSLPEFAMDLENTYPQFIRSEVDMKVLDVELAQGVDIRVKTDKFFRDVDKDPLTITDINSSSPDKVSVLQDGADLIFQGLANGKSVITLNVSDGTQTAVFTINATVAPLRASRIMVNTMPTDYPYVGDNRPELSLYGMSIDVVYNDGSVETVEYPYGGDWQVTGYQGSDAEGPQKVTLEWGGLSVQFNVYVYAMQFGSLLITDLYPQWYVGDTAQKMLEKNGLKVWGMPPGGSVNEMREILIGPGNIKGFDTSHPLESVPFWVEFGGLTSSKQYVRVLPIEMTKIELALEGVSYPDIAPSTIEGNPLDLTGWDITGVFNNGEKRKLDAKEVEIKNFDSSEPGTFTFNLAYQSVYEAVYETFNIDFTSENFWVGVQSNLPVELMINSLPEKTAYWQGDSYDSVRLDGLTFLVRYADGKTAVLPYHHEDIEIDITAFDTRLPNKTHLGIWVQLNQKGFILREEFEIPIEVVRNALTELEIVQLPAKRQFYEWVGVSENDFSDLIVKGTYENGKEVNPMPLTASNFTIDRRPGEDRKVTIAVDNEKVSFTIDIEPRKVVALELLSPPDVTNYYVGEAFNKTGMAVRYRFNSGETVDRRDLYLDDSCFSGFDSRTPVMGQVVTYRVDDASVSFTVNVQEYKLMGLRIDRLPYREWFYQYEGLSLEGMKITGLMPYDEERDMEYVLWEISGFDSSKPVQDQEVTIRIEDQTVSFTVDILPPVEVKSLTFRNTIKEEYLLGESLDMMYHDLGAVYTGYAYNPVTNNVELREFGVNIWPKAEEISGFDSSQPEDDQVLSFTFGGLTATKTIDIVEPELLSLRVIPSRTTYYTGDALKPEELTVLCTYENGYVRTMPAGSYLISGFDSTRPVQDQKVTVSYKGQSDSFFIQVLSLELKSISVNPGLTSYYLGEQFNRSMLRVSAHYNSGAIKAVPPEMVQISGFDSSREATGQEVVVSYQGKQDSFLVNILSGTRPGEPGEEPGSDPGEVPGENPGEEPGGEPGKVPEEEPGDAEDTTTTTPSGSKNTLSVTPSLDIDTGKAIAAVEETKIQEAFDKLEEDEEGVRKISIEIPTVEEAKAYVAELPSSFLTEKGAEIQLEIKTGTGTVTVPGNMLANIPEAFGKTAGITIGQGDKSALPEEVQEAIGDRPIIQLTLTLDGEQVNWNNPGAPVTVSIPYTPTEEELKNPESIVIWYIDGSGNVISVPNGRYDPESGTVTFTTTHFSYYAVSFKPVSFKDVPGDAWYAKAVSFIAAREITLGTGGGSFSPEDKLTRGQFIVMMMRAYGIAPDEDSEDNFKDAGNTWYTGYLAAARRLGISAGVGNNLFAPDNAITRQEMFTLLYNGLKVIEKLPRGNSGKTLSDFSDADEIAPWAMDAMKLLVETGIVSGSGNKLSPKDTTTRGQMAQVFYNLLSR